VSKKTPRQGNRADELLAVQRMLARERLSIDDPQLGRTCFLSHLGAQSKLVPCPWVGHRDLLYALALANLNPAQRTSLGSGVARLWMGDGFIFTRGSGGMQARGLNLWGQLAHYDTDGVGPFPLIGQR